MRNGVKTEFIHIVIKRRRFDELFLYFQCHITWFDEIQFFHAIGDGKG